MSRNAAGVYTLPPSNPVVPFTTITSSWANTTMTDLGTEITNSLDRGGRGSMTAQLKIVDGTSNTPGIGFSEDTNNGFYRDGNDIWHPSAGGVPLGAFTPTGVKTYLDPGTLIAPSFSFIGDADTGMYSSGLGEMTFISNGAPMAKISPAGVSVANGTLDATSFLAKALTTTTAAEFVASNSGATSTVRLVKYGSTDPTLPNYGMIRNLTGEMVIAQSTAAADMRFWVGATDATAERMRITQAGNILMGAITNPGLARLLVGNSAGFVSEFVIPTTTGAAAINFANGNKQKVTLTGTWEPTFTFPAVGTYQVHIVSGANTITWPAIGASWQWVGSSTTPALNTGTYGGVLTLYNNGSFTMASYASIGA